MRKDLLLRVRGLTTAIQTKSGRFDAVRDVSFDLHRREKVAIIGESGSGKSLTALSLIGLLPHPVAQVTAGEVVFDGVDLTTAEPETLRKLRGRRIGMLFQDPMTSLNPLLTIRRQLFEAVESHFLWPQDRIEERARTLLRRVQIDDPDRVMGQHPHQLSGGMRQRVMLAIALMCSPDLIIADEPTTALDVTVQREVIGLLRELTEAEECAIIFISHDINLVSEFADRILVMYAGRVVEAGPTAEICHRPRHPYTADLLRSIPRIDEPRREELLTIEGHPPAIGALPRGCAYHPRCRVAVTTCRSDEPAFRPVGIRHGAACFQLSLTEGAHLE